MSVLEGQNQMRGDEGSELTLFLFFFPLVDAYIEPYFAFVSSSEK